MLDSISPTLLRWDSDKNEIFISCILCHWTFDWLYHFTNFKLWKFFLAIPRILRRKPWCFCSQKAHHGRTCCRIHGLSWGRKRRSLQTSVQPIHQGNKIIPAIYIAPTSANKISILNMLLRINWLTPFRPESILSPWRSHTKKRMPPSVPTPPQKLRLRRPWIRSDGTAPVSATLSDATVLPKSRPLSSEPRRPRSNSDLLSVLRWYGFLYPLSSDKRWDSQFRKGLFLTSSLELVMWFEIWTSNNRMRLRLHLNQDDVVRVA